MAKELEPVPASRSYVEMTEIVMPNDANPLGNCMGGRVMHWIDVAAAIAAGRHARGPVVTASVDQLDFLHPVKVGSVVILKAAVNYAHRTSMECGVKVWTEDRVSRRLWHVASAYLTFVAIDPETGRPRSVPDVAPESEDEVRRFAAAKRRREVRLARRGGGSGAG